MVGKDVTWFTLFHPHRGFTQILRIQQLKRGRFFALVACDVHHCGFVTGAGLAVGREDAKQLAAKQVPPVVMLGKGYSPEI